MTSTTHSYRGYVFTIDYRAEDPAYGVDFPDWPMIITSGATLSEAFVNRNKPARRAKAHLRSN